VLIALPHALAAVYIGVSVAWGKRIVSWADAAGMQRTSAASGFAT
jgi:hypothetical protein